MNCRRLTAVQRAEKKAYDQARYIAKKAAHEAVHGPKIGANQWTRTHRMGNTPEYSAWTGMRGRCLNTADKSFAYYGGRGVQVCVRWESFDAFFADMGARPDGMSLDRFPDRDGNYEPGNCRWATPTEQTRNRRNTIALEYRGETKTLAEWCEQLGVNYSTAHRRLRRERLPLDRVFAGGNRA
jgi:hypothetical protein